VEQVLRSDSHPAWLQPPSRTCTEDVREERPAAGSDAQRKCSEGGQLESQLGASIPPRSNNGPDGKKHEEACEWAREDRPANNLAPFAITLISSVRYGRVIHSFPLSQSLHRRHLQWQSGFAFLHGSCAMLVARHTSMLVENLPAAQSKSTPATPVLIYRPAPSGRHMPSLPFVPATPKGANCLYRFATDRFRSGSHV